MDIFLQGELNLNSATKQEKESALALTQSQDKSKQLDYESTLVNDFDSISKRVNRYLAEYKKTWSIDAYNGFIKSSNDLKNLYLLFIKTTKKQNYIDGIKGFINLINGWASILKLPIIDV